MQVAELITQLDALVARGASFEAVLEAAVRGTHQLDPRFDWTGIYELYPDDVLRLGPFVGSPTDHVFIGVGTGVCGSAVAESTIAMNSGVSRIFVQKRRTNLNQKILSWRRKDELRTPMEVATPKTGCFLRTMFITLDSSLLLLLNLPKVEPPTQVGVCRL